MSGIISGLQSLINAIVQLLQALQLLLTWAIWFIQLPFGLGPLGKYAMPFNIFILFLFFAIVGYKTKFAMNDINAILNSFDDYADRSISKVEKVIRKKRKRRY